MANASTLPSVQMELASHLTVGQVYDFIKARYKHDRFEGRMCTDGNDYPLVVAASHLEMVQARGYGMISQFESVTGESVIFDGSLEIRPVDWFRELVRNER